MSLVRSRNERHDYAAPACCHPEGLRVCTLPRGSPRRNVTTFSYHLHSWRLAKPPAAAALAAFTPQAAPGPTAATAAASSSSAAAASSAADDAPAPLPASRYAKAPNWIFQHYTHFDAAAAHRPQPRAASALAARSRLRMQRAANSSLDEPLPFGTFGGLPPVYMVHLAALRSAQRRLDPSTSG